jgi:cell division protein FtsX
MAAFVRRRENIMATQTQKTRDNLPDSAFAFPKQRKEPLNDAAHVRNAIARFDQVEDVSDADRDQAWKRIRAAAKRHGVQVNEESWRELMG